MVKVAGTNSRGVHKLVWTLSLYRKKLNLNGVCDVPSMSNSCGFEFAVLIEDQSLLCYECVISFISGEEHSTVKGIKCSVTSRFYIVEGLTSHKIDQIQKNL